MSAEKYLVKLENDIKYIYHNNIKIGRILTKDLPIHDGDQFEFNEIKLERKTYFKERNELEIGDYVYLKLHKGKRYDAKGKINNILPPDKLGYIFLEIIEIEEILNKEGKIKITPASIQTINVNRYDVAYIDTKETVCYIKCSKCNKFLLN